MKKLIVVVVAFFSVALLAQPSGALNTPKSDVFMQGFYWNSTPGGIWWDSLASLAPRLASAGFSGIWFPAPYKGAGGGFSMGYDPYDHYDFGEYFQKGSTETRFGSRKELERALDIFHGVGIEVYADAVMRHMMGGEDKLKYTCIPVNNGNPIVPDSAYLLFNYPNGSGRFKKDAMSFYPNSLNCFVDTRFTATDPLFRFGEWLDHNNTAVRDSLIQWGIYLRNVVGFDGFRIDAVKPIDPFFMAWWIKGVQATAGNGYIVAEHWSGVDEIKGWLNSVKTNGAGISMFDFPLRFSLKEMCNATNGSYWMTNLDGAGLINNGVSSFDVATFVENHDFDRVGYDGSIDSGHDPVLADKHLAYAYILFSEGRPTVFFKDYVDYGLAGRIDTLMWIRRVHLGGGTTKRDGLNAYYIRQDGGQDQAANSRNIYVARRNGFGSQKGGYLLINNHPTQWMDVWVDTEEQIGKWYKDFTGRDNNKQVVGPASPGAKNRVKLWAPPRSYTLFVADTLSKIANEPAIELIPNFVTYTGSAFKFQVNAVAVNGAVLQYATEGAPAWLSISSTGLLSGTPAVADTGMSSIVVRITNTQGGAATDTFTVSTKFNTAPVLQNITEKTVVATKRFELQAVANDAQNDSLLYGFSAAPAWLSIGTKSGLLSGTPAIEDTGSSIITLLVTDGKGAYDSTSFTLKVLQPKDSVIATFGKPTIDGTINNSNSDWVAEWKRVTDGELDSWWNPKKDSVNKAPDNELYGFYATWDADSLYLGVDYVLNDKNNTLMIYIEAGLPGGITNFRQGTGSIYNGDYAKNIRFKTEDAIDFFVPAYFQNSPGLFRIDSNTSTNMSAVVNGVRGAAGEDAEIAMSWNDLYGLGAGKVPAGVKLKFVSVLAGGYNWGTADSQPDNEATKGTAGPDSLLVFTVVEPDTNKDGFPDPTRFVLDVRGDQESVAPQAYALLGNYPNPFNPSTVIAFTIPQAEQVELIIYDMTGAEVRTVLNSFVNAGRHDITVDMNGLPSGVYFYRLRAGVFNSVGKMLFLK